MLRPRSHDPEFSSSSVEAIDWNGHMNDCISWIIDGEECVIKQSPACAQVTLMPISNKRETNREEEGSMEERRISKHGIWYEFLESKGPLCNFFCFLFWSVKGSHGMGNLSWTNSSSYKLIFHHVVMSHTHPNLFPSGPYMWWPPPSSAAENDFDSYFSASSHPSLAALHCLRLHLNDIDTYGTLQRQKVDKAQFLLA